MCACVRTVFLQTINPVRQVVGAYIGVKRYGTLSEFLRGQSTCVLECARLQQVCSRPNPGPDSRRSAFPISSPVHECARPDQSATEHTLQGFSRRHELSQARGRREFFQVFHLPGAASGQTVFRFCRAQRGRANSRARNHQRRSSSPRRM